MKIKYNSIFILYSLLFIAFIAFIVMDTAHDRANYIKHFSDPFGSSRIEVGFQYYMNMFHFIHIPAPISIILTSVLIYFFLSRFWLKYFNFSWLFSVLLFNFMVLSLMNYYLGVSIRMGLALSLALFLSFKILEGKRFLFPIFLLTAFIHYGAILFIVVFSYFFLVRKIAIKKHILISLAGGVLLVLLFDYILPSLGFSSYYMAYFNSDFGKTDRIFPFTILFSILSLFLIFIKYKAAIQFNKYLFILSIYTIPFLIFFVFSGNPLFAKMLMPLIFIQSLLLSVLYYRSVISLIVANIFLLLVCVLNIISITYALKMYNYF